MVSNDDFDGKATHLNSFYLHINFEQKYPKPAIVAERRPKGLKPEYGKSEKKIYRISANCFHSINSVYSVKN